MDSFIVTQVSGHKCQQKHYNFQSWWTVTAYCWPWHIWVLLKTQLCYALKVLKQIYIWVLFLQRQLPECAHLLSTSFSKLYGCSKMLMVKIILMKPRVHMELIPKGWLLKNYVWRCVNHRKGNSPSSIISLELCEII